MAPPWSSGSTARAAGSEAPRFLRSSIADPQGVSQGGTYLFESRARQHFKREYISREIARAARRVLGHSDEATTLRYYVHDAFSDEELFGEMKVHGKP